MLNRKKRKKLRRKKAGSLPAMPSKALQAGKKLPIKKISQPPKKRQPNS